MHHAGPGCLAGTQEGNDLHPTDFLTCSCSASCLNFSNRSRTSIASSCAPDRGLSAAGSPTISTRSTRLGGGGGSGGGAKMVRSWRVNPRWIPRNVRSGLVRRAYACHQVGLGDHLPMDASHRGIAGEHQRRIRREELLQVMRDEQLSAGILPALPASLDLPGPPAPHLPH